MEVLVYQKKKKKKKKETALMTESCNIAVGSENVVSLVSHLFQEAVAISRVERKTLRN